MKLTSMFVAAVFLLTCASLMATNALYTCQNSIFSDMNRNCKVLDFDLEQLPQESFFEAVVEKVLVCCPDIVCLRNIGASALSSIAYEKLEKDFDQVYLSDDWLIMSKLEIIDPQVLIESVNDFVTNTNVFVSVTPSDNDFSYEFPFSFLEYNSVEETEASLVNSSFFDKHPFSYQEDAFILLCRRGGGSASGRGSYNEKGEATVSGNISYESRDGDWEASAEASATRDSQGRYSGEVSVEVGATW